MYEQSLSYKHHYEKILAVEDDLEVIAFRDFITMFAELILKYESTIAEQFLEVDTVKK